MGGDANQFLASTVSTNQKPKGLRPALHKSSFSPNCILLIFQLN